MFRNGRPFAIGACCIIFVVICNVIQVDGIPLGDFFPFRSIAGDQSLPRSDDGSSQVALTLPLPFAGGNSTELYVR